ncbi:c-type cytochrome [Mariniflexile ostreae]|uniref:C-type cytochrome n=1 Tax=Mariniflexile ostreae TaxID=1520892 RepID=A0ABV5F936_9FLAO
MKLSLNFLTIILISLLVGCGGKEEKKKASFSYENKAPTEKKVSQTEKILASEKVDLTNKGVGPIKNLTLDAEIDKALARQGKAVFKNMCASCHRLDKKFIGPAPTGILNRRTPEWIMNMILVPEQMVKEDPLAKELLLEYNGSPMINQNISEEDARAILEYYRTLK